MRGWVGRPQILAFASQQVCFLGVLGFAGLWHECLKGDCIRPPKSEPYVTFQHVNIR